MRPWSQPSAPWRHRFCFSTFGYIGQFGHHFPWVSPWICIRFLQIGGDPHVVPKPWISMTTWRYLRNLNGDLDGWISVPYPWVDQSIGDPLSHLFLVCPPWFMVGLDAMVTMVGMIWWYIITIFVLPGDWLWNWNLECPSILSQFYSILFQAHSAHQILGFISRWCFISSWRACTQKSVKSPARIHQNPMKTTDSLKSTPQCYGKMPCEVTMFDSQAPQEPVLKCAWSTVWALLPMKSHEIPICCIN